MTTDSAPRSTSAPDRAAADPLRDRGAVAGLEFPDIPRLELEQLLEQLRERADDVLATQGRLRGLLRANAAFAADLSLPTLLANIVGAARDLLRARYAAIVVLGPDAQLQEFVHAGMDEDLVTRIGRLPGGHGVLDVLTATPDPIWFADPPPGPVGSAPGHPPVGGFFGVPIYVGDDVFGNLYLRATPGRVFAAEGEQLVTALAATAGVAVANARLFAESEQRRRWLSASSHLTNELLAADTEHPLTAVTRQAMTAADADFATMTVPHGTDQVRLAAATGDGNAALGRTAAMNGSHAGRTISTGTPVLVTDYRGDAEEFATSSTTGPVMVVPLAAGGLTRGAVTLGRVSGRSGFTSADLDMAAAFGTHAAVALTLAEAQHTQLRDARTEDHDRIAFDLHDHVIGELFALGMGLQGLASVNDKPAQVARINGYVDSLDRVISTIRTTIFQLQPHRHDPAGLQKRILRIIEAHTEQFGHHPQLHFAGPIDLAVDEPLAHDVLAVTREALTNCARHAQASSVSVSLTVAHDVLTVQVIDNGRGVGTPTRSSGLANMRHRAEHHRGTLTITEPDTGGTRLTWSVPCRPGDHR